MKRLLILVWCVALSGGLAWADGLTWESLSSDALVVEKAQQAWIDWQDGRERLTVAVSPEKVSPNLAWILPIPVSAKQARLSLIDKLPGWSGEEVRANAHLAFRPGLLALFFFGMLLLVGWGYQGCLVLGIIFVLSAIAIGPGPGGLEVSEVSTFDRVELGGLVAELAEAPSVEALERYLKGKGAVLPKAARGFFAEHIREGGSFVVSWARKSKLAGSLAVEVDFPAAKPWYPVRLTSVYGKAKTPIDLKIAGWHEPDPVLPAQARIGYYRNRGRQNGAPAGPRDYTRIVFPGRAALLTQDWTFGQRKTLDLRLAALTGNSPFLANVLLLLACSTLGGLLLGPMIFPELRGSKGLARAAGLGASGVLPFLGPRLVLKSIFPDQVVVQPPPPPSDPRRRWGALVVVFGVVLQILGIWGSLEGVGTIAGWLVCSGGLSAFWLLSGHPKATSILSACLLSLIPVVGPALGLFGKPPGWNRPEPPPTRPYPLRWDGFLFALAAFSFILHVTAGARIMRLWPLDRATAIVRSSGGMANLIRKSNEGASKGNLGAIRAALSKYYHDNGEKYPPDLEALTRDGRYLSGLPLAKAPNYHPDSSHVLRLTSAQFANEELDDTGGWVYVVDGPKSGEVFVNCTHTDTKGSAWNSY